MTELTNSDPQAQAAGLTTADGAQPPRGQADTAAQDESPASREEKARSVLRGGAKEAAEAPADGNEIQRAIDAQFDPETGEFLEEDPAAAGQGEEPADAAAGETNTQEGAESPEGRQQEEEDDEEEESGEQKGKEKERAKGKRIRVRRESLTDRDFAILTLAKDKKVSFAEAERQLFGGRPAMDEAGEPGREGHAQTVEQGAQRPPTVAQITERINALRAERDAAADAMDAKRGNECNDRLADLRDLLQEARRHEAQQQQAARQIAQNRYATVETQAIHRAMELYPEANVKGSELSEAMQAKSAKLRSEDPGYFQNPRWPILLAVEIAGELGIAPKAKAKPEAEGAPLASKPAQKFAPAVIPKKVTRPVPSPAPGSASSVGAVNTEAALRAELKAATAGRDADAIKAVMRKIQLAAK